MQFAYAQSPLFFSLLWVIPFHLMAIPSESLSKQFRRAYDHLYLTGEDMEAESAVGAVVEASMSMTKMRRRWNMRWNAKYLYVILCRVPFGTHYDEVNTNNICTVRWHWATINSSRAGSGAASNPSTSNSTYTHKKERGVDRWSMIRSSTNTNTIYTAGIAAAIGGGDGNEKCHNLPLLMSLGYMIHMLPRVHDTICYFWTTKYQSKWWCGDIARGLYMIMRWGERLSSIRKQNRWV